MLLTFTKARCYLLTGTIITSCFLSTTFATANENQDQTIERIMAEVEESGIDINHTESIERVRNYIMEHVDRKLFSSLHIDRDEDPLGTIVLSFTTDLPPKMKDDLMSLVEEPTKLSFRVVSYTQDELIEKQKSVDQSVFQEKVFETEGINVYYTSPDIINNKVEIGIAPFNEQTAQLVYKYFGPEMINVVEANEVHILTEDTASTKGITPYGDEDRDKKDGFFSSIWNWIRGLFTK
ncbi:hypothetical protein [Alkalihalobacterium sp. APHAB7]|uniref:hypothetical protein n=1 Tax=Alkalihalobacterium sp. APHAB7 TaxID=3402081 RepID=UPI003AADAA72